MENLNGHDANTCKHNPNSVIICDKGCNIAITRREYESSNCLSHLSKKFILQEKEIVKSSKRFSDLSKKIILQGKEIAESSNRFSDLSKKIILQEAKICLQEKEIVNVKNALKKLNDKMHEQSLWQICYNIDISINEPNFLKYKDNNNSEHPAFAQSIRSLEPDNPNFKMQIRYEGDKTTVTIGLTPKGFPIHLIPGLIDESIGYHGIDGYLYNGNPIGEKFGPEFRNGDIIECGVKFPSDFVNGVSATVVVYFSINDEFVGERNVTMPDGGLFPTLRMRYNSTIEYFNS